MKLLTFVLVLLLIEQLIITSAILKSSYEIVKTYPDNKVSLYYVDIIYIVFTIATIYFLLKCPSLTSCKLLKPYLVVLALFKIFITLPVLEIPLADTQDTQNTQSKVVAGSLILEQVFIIGAIFYMLV